MDNLTLKKFNIGDIEDDANILILGRRRTGKSVLTKDILVHKNMNRGIVFCNKSTEPLFKDVLPNSIISSDYNTNLIETTIKNQEMKDCFCIVLDGILDIPWEKIYFDSNAFFILTMQYPLGVPPALRSNIDYVCIFNEPSISNRQKIYKDYGSVIPTFEIFNNILDECTQNYNCLVIKLSGDSSDIRDQVFWYKANII